MPEGSTCWIIWLFPHCSVHQVFPQRGLMILLGSCWIRWMTGKVATLTESPPTPMLGGLNGKTSRDGSRTNWSKRLSEPPAKKITRRSGTSSRKMRKRSKATLRWASFTAAVWGTIKAILERPPICIVIRSWMSKSWVITRSVCKTLGKSRPWGSIKGRKLVLL